MWIRYISVYWNFLADIYQELNFEKANTSSLALPVG